MEVVDKRSALLSNYEVLTLLQELESDHLARTKTALRIKKEEEAAGNHVPRTQAPSEETCENLRTVEVEAIQYLTADYQPMVSQTEAGIAQLTKSLSSYALTKAEKLQIVNLAPTEPVELYVIVEELEDRFGGQMEDIMTIVQSSLSKVASQATKPAPTRASDAYAGGAQEDAQMYNDGDWEYGAHEVVFDDTGEGAGVEGDLDVEDD